jgi:hypothetical protein
LQISGISHPQTLELPPAPQLCGETHVPQSSALPQPSGTLPQFFPSAAQVEGLHGG